MDGEEAAIVKQMIEDLDDKIEIAKRQSFDFVARLLDMARLELLIRYYGIQEDEFEKFCEAVVEGLELQKRSLSVDTSNFGSRRWRGERTKPRRPRRSGVNCN
jgi:hypothetical protein